MKKLLSAVAVIVALTTLPGGALDLDRFLALVEENHPFFEKERIKTAIEEAAAQAELGGQEWRFSMGPTYTHLGEASVAQYSSSAESLDDIQLQAGVSRTYWSTGGTLSLGVSSGYQRFGLPSPADPAETYTQSVTLSYVQPLLKNRGGELLRQDYDVSLYNISRVEAEIQETQESFLLEQAVKFLDWAAVGERLTIARTRVDLAEGQLDQISRRFSANLVDRVDVLRAEDVVRSARQAVIQLESQWRAKQAELSVVAGTGELLEATPEYDFFASAEIPDIESDAQRVRRESRLTRPLEVALEQIARQRTGLQEQMKNELDLTLSAGLAGRDEKIVESLDVLNPDFTVALEYRFPSGHKSIEARISGLNAQERQIGKEIETIGVGLEATLRNLHTQIADMQEIMDLSRRQIESATERTAEELRLYNQGRGQLTFVIQARDNEQNARLLLLENGTLFQRLLLQYRALIDRLW
jgi:outer membrane protein TolC